jgi:YbbR domain-containing protein
VLRRLLNDLGLIMLALVLAIVVWIVAVQQENPIVQNTFGEAIPIEVHNQPAGTTFLPDGFDESVTLTVRAPQKNWQDLRPDKFRAWIDLGGHEVGEYQVPVQVECLDKNVRVVELRPANIPVRLREEISRTVPVQLRLFGSPPLGWEYLTSDADVQLDPEQATVTGPKSLVEQITKVTATLDMRNTKETFIGTRPLDARRGDDEIVSFVTIEPSSVQITVPVIQKLGTSEVAVRAVVVGTVAPGYWVRGVSVDPAVVTLLGDPSAVSEIPGVVDTLPLDISGATGTIVERMPLDLPEQVSPVGEGVKVTVEIEAQQGNATILREPVIRGLGADLSATVTPKEVAITLSGPLPRIRSLTDEDVFVYVDLVDKGIGEHRIELTSLVPEGLEVVSLMPEYATVEIRPAVPTPTPTWTPTPTRTPTPAPTVSTTVTATNGITLTMTPTVTATDGITLTTTPTVTATVRAQQTPQATGSATPVPVTPTMTPTKKEQ